MTRRREIFECPHCGADVPVGARACRECGSDAGTGWQESEEVDYQSVPLPDDDLVGAAKPRGIPWIAIVAIVAAAALLALTVLRW
jgi:hypothetical protein